MARRSTILKRLPYDLSVALQTAGSRRVVGVVSRAHVSRYASANRNGLDTVALDAGDVDPISGLWELSVVDVCALFILFAAFNVCIPFPFRVASFCSGLPYCICHMRSYLRCPPSLLFYFRLPNVRLVLVQRRVGGCDGLFLPHTYVC